MTGPIIIADVDCVDEAFGSLGLKVASRTGTLKRTQDEKEWFVIRRFLKAAIELRMFSVPLNVNKESPPSPDFSLNNTSVSWVEITEATSERDQRDLTLSESRNEATLLGSDGGRFSDGVVGSYAERVLVSDILRAIRRKRSKSIFSPLNSDRNLIVYVNIPALIVIDDEEAISLLWEKIGRRRASLVRTTNGCKVHVLYGETVLFDVLR